MVGTSNVQQSFVEKQCFSVAYKLISRVVEMKGCCSPPQDPAIDPRIRVLIRELDKWVEHLVYMEGAL